MKALQRSKGWSVAALICVLMAQMVLPCYAVTEEEINAAQQEADAAENAVEEKQEEIDALEGEKEALEADLATLLEKAEALEQELQTLDEEISQKELSLDRTKAALDRVQLDADEQYDNMKMRIKYMYEKGNSVGLLVSLLDAGSVTELFTRAENYQQMVRYDREKLTEYQDTIAAVRQQKEKLEEEQSALQELHDEQEEAKDEVEVLATETDKKIEEYTTLIGEEELAKEALEEKFRAQTTIVANLRAKAEQERREAEERAKREAEIARIAAEAAAQKEAQNAAAAQTTQSSSPAKEETVEEETHTADSSASSGGTFLGTFTITAYCPCAQCCGRANHPTASGVMPQEGRTVAMYGIPFGTKLRINGHVYTVEDRGTPYGHVDIFMNSHQACLQFGRQYMEVYQVG